MRCSLAKVEDVPGARAANAFSFKDPVASPRLLLLRVGELAGCPCPSSPRSEVLFSLMENLHLCKPDLVHRYVKYTESF